MGKKSCQQPDERLDSPDLESNDDHKQSTNLQRLTLQAPTVLFQATVGVSWRIKKSHADATCKRLTRSDFSTTRNMGFGGERQRDIPQSASEAGKSQPSGQQGVSLSRQASQASAPTVLIVQHKALANARKNLFICDGFSNHINWNDKGCDSKCQTIMFKIHWNGAKDLTTELNDQGLNNGN